MDTIRIENPELLEQIKNCKPGETVNVTLLVEEVDKPIVTKAEVTGEDTELEEVVLPAVTLSGSATAYEKVEAEEAEEEEVVEDYPESSAKPLEE